MKKIYFVSIILLALAFVFVSCSFLFDEQNGNTSNGNTSNGNTSNDNTSNDNSTSNNSQIDSKYWGTWIQMDTGSEYYIDNKNVYKISSNGYKSEIQSGISGYYLESNEVLRNGSTVFFRKGGKNRRFSATVSGFSPRSARGIGTGSQGISGRRENEENPADNETATSDEDGSINFDGGVADDPQIVTVEQGNESGSATITPKYDGENVGSIPVVESGKYAFKTTYNVSNADSQGFMYGNNMGLYEISFNLTNIGYETCATSVYTISWEDTNLFSQNFEKQGNFTSIKSGASKTITGSFSYGYFDEEYKDVTISIEITDSKYEKTWYDYVTLRFYRGWIDYKVKARNFNASSSAKLNGFLVYPDGRSKRFTVSSGNITTVSIPWSTRDYYLVFSGANDETEMCYSFVASEFGAPADLSGVWSIADINAYENNDSINDAVYISNNEISTKAYLKNGDIDYFKFNVSNLTCSKGGLEYLEYQYTDEGDSEPKPGASLLKDWAVRNAPINPGDSIWMDVAIYNSSKITFSDVLVEIDSTSEYITFDSAKKISYGDIKGGFVKTYWNEKCKEFFGASYNTYNSNLTSDDYFLSKLTPFKFTISTDCPVGTVIPIRIKMTPQNGYEWIDSFDITVE
jgi:hypothetical protein